MSDHTEIEELLALEALGGLEPEDRARLDVLLAEHGADLEYAELRRGFADTAAMLGTGLRPTEVSAGLEDRTVAAALAGVRRRSRRPIAAATPSSRSPPRWCSSLSARSAGISRRRATLSSPP